MNRNGDGVTGRTRVGFLDAFALRPLADRWRDAQMVFRGDPHVPPSRFGLSSTKIFKPSISFRTWLGISRKDGRCPIYNFYNHSQTPIEEGWSVRVTQVSDFRGGSYTYDSHNGTDFAVPVGTPVVPSAPGKVLLILNEFHRGGLKIFIDHGRGLLTSYNHLSRSLVQVGDLVTRGQSIALSGASGLELLLCFPWVAPHIHYNVWLNGEYVDPFARLGVEEASLWLRGSHPTPHRGEQPDPLSEYEPTRWDEAAIEAAIDDCQVAELQRRLRDIDDGDVRALTLFQQLSYYPGRFTRKHSLYPSEAPRTPWLDLPLRAEDYVGVTYPGFQGD